MMYVVKQDLNERESQREEILFMFIPYLEKRKRENPAANRRQIDLHDNRMAAFVPVCTLLLLLLGTSVFSLTTVQEWFRPRYFMTGTFVFFWPIWSYCRGLFMFASVLVVQTLIVVSGFMIGMPGTLAVFLYIFMPGWLAFKDAYRGFFH